MNDSQTIVVGLRPWAEEDLPLLERLMGDPVMTEHLGGAESPAKLRERHARYLALEPAKGRMFVIVIGPQHVPAGSVGYWSRDSHGQQVWETGWSVLPEFQGKGIATRATAALVEKAREVGTRQFIHAYPSVHNGSSNAICRKLGFTFQGASDFEYPPGTIVRCNDWRFDLFDESAGSRSG